MSDDFHMYLSGNEDGDVQIICTHDNCMQPGRTTSTNPKGLWLRDVGCLPYQPSPDQVQQAWKRHLHDAHGTA